VYTFVVFLISSVIFFSAAIKTEADKILSASPEMIVQRVIAGRHDLIPLEYVDKIKNIRGARDVKPRLWGYYFQPATGTNYTIMAPDDFRHKEDQVVIGDGVLRTWGKMYKNKLSFETYDGQVLTLGIAGTFSSQSDLISSDLILTSKASFRRLFGLPEYFATDLVLRIRNPKETSTIAKKIKLILPDTRPVQKDEIKRTYAALFGWRSGFIIVLLAAAIASFFIFALDKATGLSAEEKREIGILKGVGWDTSDILLMKFWEGATVSLTAFLMGVILAYIHVYFASAPLFEHALKGWAVLYPKFTLKPEINLFQLTTLFFLTVLPYSLVTIIPCWKVSVSDPDSVMREN
jgi:ABC-type lipoprotein release transport system permease subunit